jgi:vacuolar-type H+-ATPase subunit D/Vma8
MDFHGWECYVSAEVNIMSARLPSVTSGSTEAYIRELASRHQVVFVPTRLDAFAQDVTRLAADDVRLDEVECLLLGLQRAGHLSRPELVHLQAKYLREAKL